MAALTKESPEFNLDIITEESVKIQREGDPPFLKKKKKKAGARGSKRKEKQKYLETKNIC